MEDRTGRFTDYEWRYFICGLTCLTLGEFIVSSVCLVIKNLLNILTSHSKMIFFDDNRRYENRTYGPYGYWNTYSPWYDYYDDWELTDEEIKDDVESSIGADPYLTRREIDNIDVEVNNGVVTLTGVVTKRSSKWVAFNDSYWVNGVRDVINKI